MSGVAYLSAAASRVAPLLVALTLAGCATAGGASAGRDPLEPLNRAIFDFNDAVDRAVLKPVAQAYQDSLPVEAREIIGNVFGNLADLWTAANQLLQGKPAEAASDLSRFVLNSTLGFAGLADIATPAGFEKHHEDFGQTLGRWGIPTGPYLVLPLLGPSNFRDAPARVVDAQGDLVLTIDSEGQRAGAVAARVIDERAGLLRGERLVEGAALDRYSFIRDGYLQRRRNMVYDGDPPPSPDDDPGYDPADDPEGPAASPPAPQPTPAGNR